MSRWVVVAVDPDPELGGTYAVGPFDDLQIAREYATGVRRVVGIEGAAHVLELDDPEDLERWAWSPVEGPPEA